MQRSNILLIPVYVLAVCLLLSCKKDKIYTPVPFLTAKTWIADTITINPPMTFSQLSSADQQSFLGANGWFKLARITLNEDGTVTTGGDYDLGFKKWRLVNNKQDIEMTPYYGDKLVLRNWFADATHFSYTNEIKLSTKFDCTYSYK